MSNVKQSQPTRHKLTKPFRRQLQLARWAEAISAIQSMLTIPFRCGVHSAGADSLALRVVTDRLKVHRHHQTAPQALVPPSRLQPPQSTSILKRSLSKLRIRDPIQPDSRHKSSQTNRSVESVASKIPQATAPTSTFSRVIRGHLPSQRSFVHDLPSSQSKLQSRRPQQHASSATAIQSCPSEPAQPFNILDVSLQSR